MVKSACVKKMFCGCMPLLWALLLGGCADSTHQKTHYGAFFYDTNTIGTIRVEWDTKEVFNPVATDYKDFNINSWLDFYNIATSKLTKSIRLQKNAYSSNHQQSKFVAPWLLYHVTKSASETHTVMLNVETNKKWILPKSYYPKGISTKGTYAIIDDKVVRRDDGSLFLQFYDNEHPVYFDEDSSILISRKFGHYLKTYIDIDKIDTLGTYSQIGALRMVANNRFAIVNAVDTSEATGLPFVVSGLITVENLMAGRFQTEPLKFGITEYLPEKNWWVIDGKINVTTEQLIVSTSMYTILKP